MKNRLISIDDLEYQDIQRIFFLAQKLKRSPEKYRRALAGRVFGLIFEKPSTRTWISFETGIFSMGGGTIYLGPEDMKLGVREEVRDVARVLDRYLTGVVLRTFSHRTIIEFERYFRHPIINGLSDNEHPCQALADFFTIQEKFGTKRKPKISFIGDGNNVLNSLLLLSAKLGARFSYATPRAYPPSAGILRKARTDARKTGAEIEGGFDPSAAVRDADVVYTDVWVSMGQESERQKKIRHFKGMQVNGVLLRKARKNAFVMHCLPAHRGEEITNEVIESQQSIVFDQAENRLHVQKAILLHLCQVA